MAGSKIYAFLIYQARWRRRCPLRKNSFPLLKNLPRGTPFRKL